MACLSRDLKLILNLDLYELSSHDEAIDFVFNSLFYHKLCKFNQTDLDLLKLLQSFLPFNIVHAKTVNEGLLLQRFLNCWFNTKPPMLEQDECSRLLVKISKSSPRLKIYYQPKTSTYKSDLAP